MKTISAAYLSEQQDLHKDPQYGLASTKFAPLVAKIIQATKPNTLTDYGAGKKRLESSLSQLNALSNITYQPYDPVFPDYGKPLKADLVCCIDVLEHIEPNLLNNVLKDLSSITTGFGFFTIHMGKAGKVLSDGRNAHLIQKPTSWWLPKLCNYFEINQLQHHTTYGRGFWVIVNPKGTKI